MEKAFWNEQLLYAYEISSDYKLEKCIKRASKNGDLYCTDPDCKMPRLKYCHGDSKGAYFAHVENCDCDYAKYDFQNSFALRKLQIKLFDSLKRKYKVEIDSKTLKDHYTPLLVTLPSDKKIAIEIVTKKTQISDIELLVQKYKQQDLLLHWVYATDKLHITKENESYFMKRYILNESAQKSILMINYTNQKIIQYSQDTEQYLSASGNKLEIPGFTELYWKTGPMSDIEVTVDSIGLRGYSENFEQWKCNKKQAYENLKKRASEAKRSSDVNKETKATINDAVDYLLISGVWQNVDSLIETAKNNPDYSIYDDKYNKYRICDVCGRLKKAFCFDPYIFINHNQNIGICKMCKSKQVKENS